MWLGALLLSCAGPSDPPPQPVDSGTDTCVDTWESFAGDTLRTWCTACHSSELGPGARYDAPLGIDFDTYARAVELAPLIVSSSTGDDPSMPPVGGPSAEERERLATWVACGTPGEGDPAPPTCSDSGERWEGDAVVASQVDADALCAAAASVAGDLTVQGSADLRCLCGVDGSVTVGGGAVAVDLGGLSRIGGALTVEAAPGLSSLELSDLVSVGSEVRFADVGLGRVALPSLVTVGGGLIVSELPAADRVDLSRLATVEGSLELTGLPAFSNLVGEGFTLEEVGGNLVLDDLDAWYGANVFSSLQRIGGDLVVSRNDVLSQLNGFGALTSVGHVRIEDNEGLEGLEGFDSLEVLPGDLVLARNPGLRVEAAFGGLRSVLGTVSVVDNPRLGTFGGLATVDEVGSLVYTGTADVTGLEPWALRQVHGDLVLRDHAALTLIDGFQALEAVQGDLEISHCPALARLNDLGPLLDIGGSLLLVDDASLVLMPALSDLQTIGDSLEIRNNAALSNVVPLLGLAAVGGDVVVTGNPSLADSGVQALVDSIGTIGGAVTVSNNGG